MNVFPSEMLAQRFRKEIVYILQICNTYSYATLRNRYRCVSPDKN